MTAPGVPSRARPKVLFVCTGNYYRSRFAERLFVDRAPALGLDWEAESRGLFDTPNPKNVGFMSPYAVSRLRELGVDAGPRDRFPMKLTEDDLKRATRVVVLDDTEHLPLLAARFPSWVDRVDDWRVHDIDRWAPAVALERIDHRVSQLLAALVEAATGEVARVRRPLASAPPARPRGSARG